MEIIQQVQTATWNQLHGRPSITVSAKGIANGLSNIQNDGADFGPDSLQADGSLTQSYGLQEAGNYVIPTGGKITLTTGYFYIDVPVVIASQHAIYLNGIRANITRGGVLGNSLGTILMPGSSYPTTSDPLITFLNTGSGNNDGYVDVGNFSIIGYFLVAGDTIPAVSAASSPVGLQFGNTNINEGNGPVSKNIHDLKIIDCVSAYTTYSGGGPSFYDNLQINACGYLGVVGNGQSNYPSINSYDLSAHYGKLEIFSANGNDVFRVNDGAGGYAPSILIDQLYTNIAANSVFNVVTTLPDVYIAIGKVNLAGAANDGSPLISLPLSGTLTVHIGSMFQGGSALIRQYNNSSTAILSFSIANYYATNSTMIVVSGGSLAAGSFLNIANAILDSTTIIPTATAISGLVFTMQSVLPKPTPSLSVNPPVSATVYQNTNPFSIEIDLPVYATTAGTAGYVTLAKGTTDTPATIGNQYVSGATSATSVDIIRLRVPAGWYFSFTASGVTLGTATVFAD